MCIPDKLSSPRKPSWVTLLSGLPLPCAPQTPLRKLFRYSLYPSYPFILPFCSLCSELLEGRTVSCSLSLLFLSECCSPEHIVGAQ